MRVSKVKRGAKDWTDVKKFLLGDAAGYGFGRWHGVLKKFCVQGFLYMRLTH